MDRLRAVSMDHSMGSLGVLFEWDVFFLEYALEGTKLRSISISRLGIDLLYVSKEKARILASHVSKVVHRRIAFEFNRAMRPERRIMSCGPHGYIIHSMFQGCPQSVLRMIGDLSDCAVIKKDPQNRGLPLVCEESGGDCRIGLNECIYPIPAGYIPCELD